MPRMRTLKPEAATSETLAQVDPAVRWTFAMLWTYCDDEGRGVCNPRLIKAAIYPLDDDMIGEVVERHLKELERVGAVCFYSVDGRSMLHVPAWGEHQHPNRKVESKLPPCPETDHSPAAQAQRSADALSPPGALTPVVVVEGRVDGEVDVGGEAATRAPTTTAQTLIAEWMERSPKRPPSQVIKIIGKHVAAMLAEGIDPNDIRRGLRAWMDKGLHENTLPSVVNEVMNSRPSTNGAGKATNKAAGWLTIDQPNGAAIEGAT